MVKAIPSDDLQLDALDVNAMPDLEDEGVGPLDSPAQFDSDADCEEDVRDGTIGDLQSDAPDGDTFYCVESGDVVWPAVPDSFYEPAHCLDERLPTNAEEILSYIGAEWPVYCLAEQGPLPISPTLVIDAVTELDAGNVPLPSGCGVAGGIGPCLGPWFDVSRGAPVTILEYRTFVGQVGHQYQPVRVSLNPGKYRLRPQIVHNVWGGSEVFIELLTGCADPCPEGLRYCPWDRRCLEPSKYDDYRFCVACLSGSDSVCACWSPSGAWEDGQLCWYGADCGGMHYLGRCNEGVCTCAAW